MVALASFAILGLAVICDYLRQKKRENKFTRRFLLAKTRGEKQNTSFDSHDFVPDARYECIIKFSILGKRALNTLLSHKYREKEVGSKRVFVSPRLNTSQTTQATYPQVSIGYNHIGSMKEALQYLKQMGMFE